MELLIDTTHKEIVKVGIGGKVYSRSSKVLKSQMLLPFIVDVMAKQKVKFSDLTSINFNSGPGSFTGLRVGLSVANAISWNYKIPVNGKKVWAGEMVEIKYD